MSATDVPAPRDAVVITSAATAGPLAAVLAARPDALVVAADGGLAAASELGARVDVIVGDFDSADPEQVRAATRRGAAIERHSCAKDATDLELAVRCALARGATRVCVVDSARGRVDHFLGTVGFLASPALVGVDVTARIDDATVFVVHGGGFRAVPAHVGAMITLLPFGGDALGVTTEGLRFALDAATLPAGTTRGVSNVVEEPYVRVSLNAGALLIIVPGTSESGPR
jgi:thiamine pyrophosphokinase